MRVPYCDGYYKEGENFYWHNEETGRDYIVSEDEAIAHKPFMYVIDEDHADTLVARYNQYRDFLDVLEELLDEAKESENTLAEIEFSNTITSFKNAQTVILKRLGIVF